MVLKPEDYERMANSEADRAKGIIDASPAKALVHATLASAYATLAHAAAVAAPAGERRVPARGVDA